LKFWRGTQPQHNSDTGAKNEPTKERIQAVDLEPSKVPDDRYNAAVQAGMKSVTHV